MKEKSGLVNSVRFVSVHGQVLYWWVLTQFGAIFLDFQRQDREKIVPAFMTISLCLRFDGSLRLDWKVPPLLYYSSWRLTFLITENK